MKPWLSKISVQIQIVTSLSDVFIPQFANRACGIICKKAHVTFMSMLLSQILSISVWWSVALIIAKPLRHKMHFITMLH